MPSRDANEPASDQNEPVYDQVEILARGDRLIRLPRGLETLVKCLHSYVEAEPSRFEVVERVSGERLVKMVRLRKDPVQP
jgi:hypothetical protein